MENSVNSLAASVNNIQLTAHDKNLFNSQCETVTRKIDDLLTKVAEHERKQHDELEEHFEQIVKSIYQKKQDQQDELKNKIQVLRSKIVDIKSNFDNEVEKYERICDSISRKQVQPTSNGNQLQQTKNPERVGEHTSDLDDDECALIINDYCMGEYSFEDYSEQLKQIYENIQTTQVFKNEESLLTDLLSVRLATSGCSFADLDTLCFGHIETNGSFSVRAHKELLDHSQFKFVDCKLEKSKTENSTEVASYAITFSCPNPLGLTFESAEKEHLHDLWKVEIRDKNNQVQNVQRKERFENLKRYMRICFTPTTSGIFTISFKYNNVHIKNSPFMLMITQNQLSSSPISVKSTADSIKPVATEPVSLKEKLSKNSAFIEKFSAGRGRLLARQDSLKSKFPQISPEKRKVSMQTTDLNNNQMDCSETHVKKINVDESANTIHNYSSVSSIQSISNLMHLDINVASESKAFKFETREATMALSNHLKQFVSRNGLVKLIDSGVKNMKATFVCKYEKNLHFPIGVRTSRGRLYVCDSGNNMVKVFNEKSGEFLLEIKRSFQRPSAILVCEKRNELFVKDDNEVFVFKADSGEFLRSFGAAYLSRPYGLAFNKNGDIVLIDADLKNPLIYVFKKESGEVLSKKCYKPGVRAISDSDKLMSQFSGGKKKILSNLQSFDKTKFRFMCISDDHLYVSDLGRSIVYKSSLQGDMELAFGHFGKAKGQMNEPSGIHVDGDGQAILVADSKNNRFQIYNGEGMYKCDLELDNNIQRPSDIYLDSENNLYVSCFISHNVKKFKLNA